MGGDSRAGDRRYRATMELKDAGDGRTTLWLLVEAELNAGAVTGDAAEPDWQDDGQDSDLEYEIVYRTRKKLGR